MKKAIGGLAASLMLMVGAGAAWGGADGVDAAGVSTMTRIAGGLVAFPRATGRDELLAMELARRPSFVVHMASKDDTTVMRLRVTGDAGGVLGRSLYVEKGSATTLPFADRLVDMLVVTDLGDADLTPDLKREWMRVLAPGRGAALLGRSASAGAGLGEAALKAWVSDVPNAEVIKNDAGMWVVIRTALPAGSDPWTHRCHGADNAQVSSDSTFKAPFLAQWWGLPRQEGFWGTTVVSGNGRLFTIRSSRNRYESVYLTARSLTSGLVLWQTILRQADDSAEIPHNGYIPGRACAVVNGDDLCLIDRDGVVLRHGETGEVVDRIAGPLAGGQLKWMAISRNKLAVLAGEADIMGHVACQTVSSNPVGRVLAVYDLASRKELWRDSVAGDIDERSPAIREGSLYYLAQGVGVVARDLATGKELWRNDSGIIQTNFMTPELEKSSGLLVSQPSMLALDDVIIMRAPWAKEIMTLSRKDGALLWKRPNGLTYRALTAVPMDGRWIGDKGLLIDLWSGESTNGPGFVSSSCGPTLATPDYMISCFGVVKDVKTGERIRPADLKSPCDVGTLVSEGVMVTMPSQCACLYDLKCYRALVSAGGVKVHEAPPWKERFTAVSTVPPAPMALTEADWPTYRHDVQRSGASTAAVGEAGKILWRWKPNGAVPYENVAKHSSIPRTVPDYVATAPVTGGGNIYFGSHDGVIRCLRAESGKEVWTFATGAMLLAPPTLWEGRLLAGGGDGRVYCLDATTGKLLWSLLVAPQDRRVFWMGHLINTWPLAGGVVIKDGVGYAVAGYQADSGIHACAFEAGTGKVIWERHDAGKGKGKLATGMTSGGGLTIAGGKLCLAGWTGGTFDLKTGEWDMTNGIAFGSEIGVLCDQWVVRGGRRLTELEDAIRSPVNKGFSLGIPGLTSLPAWDEAMVVLSPIKVVGSLVAVPADAFVKRESEGGASSTVGGVTNAPTARTKTVEVEDIKRWESVSGLFAGFVMAKNVVVAAGVDPKQGHKLVALRRDTGAEVWSVDLPEQPAMNRLAIDRDGRVIVSLSDGSVICVGK